MHRPTPKPEKPESLITAWIRALQAFARLCDRTNVGGLTEDQTRIVSDEIARLTRQMNRTQVK